MFVHGRQLHDLVFMKQDPLHYFTSTGSSKSNDKGAGEPWLLKGVTADVATGDTHVVN